MALLLLRVTDLCSACAFGSCMGGYPSMVAFVALIRDRYTVIRFFMRLFKFLQSEQTSEILSCYKYIFDTVCDLTKL